MKYYVALDIGNVLCKIDFRKFTFAVGAVTNLSSWEVGHRVNRSQKLRDVGLVTMTDVLESEFGIKSSVVLENLLGVWNNDVLKFDNRVFDFFTTLGESVHDNLNVALLSNVGLEHSLIIDAYINSRYHDTYNSKLFVNAIRHYSCNLGVRKPQSLYYQSFLLDNAGFKGCVYLDDLKENLVASTKFGFVPVEFNLETLQDINAPLEAIKTLILDRDNTNSRWH